MVLPSEIRYVDIAHAAAEKAAETAGCDEDTALNVGIAVREAVINAMLHGNRLDPNRKVELAFAFGARGMRARVRDHGRGFDPAATPDPTSTENLLSTSGRGLLMMRAYCDAVEFRYHEGRGMEVTLVKKVHSTGRVAPEGR
jgi:serine/threonine-protein kinase RsbW